MNIKERLLSKVEFIPEHTCWEWTASKFKDGYWQIKIRGKNRKSHRVSYEEFIGPIPEGMLICHTCDNPGYIRPEHLFLGTWKSNMIDMVNKGRNSGKNGNSYKTSCIYGHEYSDKNTYFLKYTSGNLRVYKICTSRRNAKAYRKRINKGVSENE